MRLAAVEATDHLLPLIVDERYGGMSKICSISGEKLAASYYRAAIRGSPPLIIFQSLAERPFMSHI
jgi:hypothetical protein